MDAQTEFMCHVVGISLMTWSIFHTANPPTSGRMKTSTTKTNGMTTKSNQTPSRFRNSHSRPSATTMVAYGLLLIVLVMLLMVRDGVMCLADAMRLFGSDATGNHKTPD